MKKRLKDLAEVFLINTISWTLVILVIGGMVFAVKKLMSDYGILGGSICLGLLYGSCATLKRFWETKP